MSLILSLFKPLAYLSLPVFLLHTASNISPLARYYVRVSLYLSTLGLCSAWGTLVSIGMSLIGRRFDVNWVVARSFYALAGKALGIKFEVEGEEYLREAPSVVVGNHQSMLDVLYLGRILPQRLSMTAKKELQWVPILGQYMSLSGTVFIDRAKNGRGVESLRAAAETMKRRAISLWLFPEGTRSSTQETHLLPFKKGPFHLAVQAGVPITPVVCENYWRLYHAGTFESGTLKIKVLPPVPTEGMTSSDVPRLVEMVRERMLEALHEISGTRPAVSVEGGESEKEEVDLESKQTQESGVVVPEAETTMGVTRPVPAQVEGETKPEVETPPHTSSLAEGGAVTPVPGSSGPSSEDIAMSSSNASISQSWRGTETDEEEGMVIVDLPRA